jgi:SAM-dependent methyltransferase
MKECAKASKRRFADPDFVTRYFTGHGLDIGAGPDPLALYASFFPRIARVESWDTPQGDAQLLAGIADESFDFVHSSHCLEHLVDCEAGLRNWFRVLKPSGHLVVTVPDEDLYEQGVFPSSFNTDHKWTFTTWKAKSWIPVSRNVVSLIAALGPAAELKRLCQIEAGYRYDLPRFDQTLTPIAEAAIEFVVRKRRAEEIAAGGLAPRAGALSANDVALLTGLTVKPAGRP